MKASEMEKNKEKYWNQTKIIYSSEQDKIAEFFKKMVAALS